ncbi:uncharacterized protein [Halyomorpha halys]|uniref:uncharacterized protein n=1 Tax=Halyomorpha halys TaxID=286706 RepID=UPI0034D1569F
MFKFFHLVLYTAVAAAEGHKTNINGVMDRFMELINDHQREYGVTSGPLPEIPLVSKVKYYNAVFLGIDSIQRTGDCWQEVKGSDVSYDIHYGFRLMGIMLPYLEVYGNNMSAFASVRDNSVHLAFTMHLGDEKCNVTLDELRVERMDKVEFRASRPEYDDLHLDGYFKMIVIPRLNSIMDSHLDKIEASLQELCKLKQYQDDADLQDVLSFFHNQ